MQEGIDDAASFGIIESSFALALAVAVAVAVARALTLTLAFAYMAAKLLRNSYRIDQQFRMSTDKFKSMDISLLRIPGSATPNMSNSSSPTSFGLRTAVLSCSGKAIL